MHSFPFYNAEFEADSVLMGPLSVLISIHT